MAKNCEEKVNELMKEFRKGVTEKRRQEILDAVRECKLKMVEI